MPSKATRFGNYTDYSGVAKAGGSASHVPDPRLLQLVSLIPALFTAKTCLDIGCNAGGVSCQLALNFQAASVVGVDKDAKLVAQAQKLLALRASRVRPATTHSLRQCEYYPISAVLSHGYRIEPEQQISPTTAASVPTLPRWPPVRFHTADWVTSDNQHLTGPYHVILALSVIKWIHLEHLDPGLLDFFAKCSSALAQGGYLIIELQTWDSYEKAVRPNAAPHLADNLRLLQYRPETSFDDLLAKQGLHLSNSTNVLPRRLNVYRKT
ncbi:hypothetical protein ACN47E_006725 [Coniothyrium glycines]